MSRFTYGPAAPAFTTPGIAPTPGLPAPTPSPTGLPDVAPTFTSFDPTVNPAPFVLAQPAYDPTQFNAVVAYHAVIVPTGTVLPTDPSALLTTFAANSFSLPTGGHTGAGAATLPIPTTGLTPGTSYFAQSIIEFAS